jgi:glycolate oxidase iron-sulfur subunit
MRALERNEIGSDDAALTQHLDACLGCRGCEPVCPSGVAYGRGLETARERLFEERGLPPLARTVLGVFRKELLWRPLFTAARALRATGVPRLMAGAGRVGFAMGMLAASRPRQRTDASRRPAGGDGPRATVALPCCANWPGPTPSPFTSARTAATFRIATSECSAKR